MLVLIIKTAAYILIFLISNPENRKGPGTKKKVELKQIRRTKL